MGWVLDLLIWRCFTVLSLLPHLLHLPYSNTTSSAEPSLSTLPKNSALLQYLISSLLYSFTLALLTIQIFFFSFLPIVFSPPECKLLEKGIFVFFFFFLCHVACGSQFPDQEWNPCPLQWKRGVLTTGPPGKSLSIFYSVTILSIQNCA